MKKYIGLFLLAISMLVMVGCTQNKAEESAQNNEIDNEQCSFSVYKKTEENTIAVEYQDTIFSIELPAEFTLEKRDLSNGSFSKKYLPSDADSFETVYEILISDSVAGAVGVSAFTTSTCPVELIDVYGAVVLPNDYHFCIDEENYHTVKRNFTGETGITKVYYSPAISGNVGYGDKTVYNDGILAYSDRDNILVAMEFEAGAFNENQLQSIAKNIKYIIEGSDISRQTPVTSGRTDIDYPYIEYTYELYEENLNSENCYAMGYPYSSPEIYEGIISYQQAANITGDLLRYVCEDTTPENKPSYIAFRYKQKDEMAVDDTDKFDCSMHLWRDRDMKDNLPYYDIYVDAITGEIISLRYSSCETRQLMLNETDYLKYDITAEQAEEKFLPEIQSWLTFFGDGDQITDFVYLNDGVENDIDQKLQNYIIVVQTAGGKTHSFKFFKADDSLRIYKNGKTIIE